MKIKKIECDQFAGINDKTIDFNDNINILYGKNESGKSTILELLHALLFQKASLNKKTDKDFIQKNFPHKATGVDGDIIDGKITIENNGDKYTLAREWEVGKGSEKIKDQNGTLIKDEEKINKILTSLLTYEKGVYDEIILSSQKIPQHTLESIFGEIKKDYDVKSELRSILMQSVAAIGGADIDAIENKLLDRMKTLGNHFDITTRAPEEGTNRRWKKEVGEILDAYYKLKDLKSERDEIVEIETRIEEINKEKKQLVDEKTETNKEIEDIDKYSKVKMQKDGLQEQRNYQNEVINDGNNVLPIWEKFNKDKNDVLNKKVVEVSKDDIKQVEKLQKENITIKSKLNALDLDIKIDNKSGKELKVTSAETGDIINGDGNTYSINGAAEIDIPEVINIKLMPKDVDLDTLNNRQKEIDEEIKNIYKKYDVSDFDALEKLEEEYNKYQNELSNIKSREESIKQYEIKYKSVEELKKLIENAKEEINVINEKIEKLGDIPEEIDAITDLDQYASEKKDRLSEIDEEIEGKNVELQDESESLAGRESDSLIDKISELEKEYKAKVNEYKHYDNIYTKFKALKQQINADPMLDIEESFNDYLKQISQNSISIIDGSSPDDVKIKSSNNRLTIGTLSEGTKATIGIAFKLAVIEHLFPEGNGLAVFDDPFTDMDEDRMKVACQLINKFSENNQVIFVTCDKKYLNEFPNANVINM